MTQPPDAHASAVDTAWRIHAALTEWTARVDTKGSFVLTVESVALVAIGTLSHADGKRPVTGVFPNIVFWLGVGSLVAAILLAAAAVAPYTRRKSLQAEWRDNFIYFGHLKHWDAEELTEALRARDTLPILSRQLTVMSKIAWKKHQRVQGSLLMAIGGAFAVALAGLIG
jgi:hypothetical protein